MMTWAPFLATAFIFGLHLLPLSLCRIQADQLPDKSDALLSLSEVTDIAGDGKGTSRHTFRQSAKESMSHKDIVKLDRVSPTQLHDVIFFIQQRNIEELTKILYDVSDPISPNYGKHMTSKEIADLTASPEARSKVLTYLDAAGASIIAETLHGEYITARAPVSLWEDMLDTEFFTYAVLPQKRYRIEEDESIRNYIRTERYSVPTVLDAHIDSIFNTIQMPPPMAPQKKVQSKHIRSSSTHKHHVSTSATFTPDGYITPAYLIYHYNITTNKGHPRAIQGVFAGYDQYYSPADLKSFQTKFNLPDQPVYKSLGQHNNSAQWCSANIDYCGEGDLDLEYMMAVSQSPTIFYYTDLGLSSSWLIEMANMLEPPLVMSISYGIEERWIDSNYMNAFNTQAIKLGVMGVTLLSSSGDDGATSWSVRDHPENCAYFPVFPNTSPYVLSVGGTQVSILHLTKCSLYTSHS